MVDLVKIRRKARKKEEDEARSLGEAAVVSSHAAAQAEQHVTPAPARNDTDVSVPGSAVAALGSQPPAPDAGSPTVGGDEIPPPAGLTKLDRFKEEAGKRREGFVAAEAVAETAEQLELLTFSIAGEQYAVNIEHIVEIVPTRDATRVPNAHESIVGIISLRGTIVTIVDVRQTLRHPPSGALGPDARVVVVQYGGETLGFVVDRVVRVVKVDRTAVEPHPIVHSSEQSEAIRGVFRHANALTILLDFDKLLAARHGTYL